MCTRVFNNDPKTIFTTGRNMDWAEQLDTSMYLFPKGSERTGLSKADAQQIEPIGWEAKYESVVSMVGGIASSDGINSAGLVANVLYQSDCEYVDPDHYAGKKGLSTLRWVQYVLDNFKNVRQVVKAFKNNNELVIVGANVPQPTGDGAPALLHLSVSDRSGNSVIIEVNDGKFDVMSSPAYKVMTNDPKFRHQLRLNAYWEWQWNTTENTHPSDTLPGSPFSPDRFATASYYVNHLEAVKTEREAVAQMFTVIQNASVPMGFVPSTTSDLAEPNISQTLWSTVSSHKSLRYYFRDVMQPNVFWTDLKKPIKFPTSKKGKACLSLELQNKKGYIYYAGCVNDDYKAGIDPFAA